MSAETVLCVDDTPANRYIRRRILGSAGFKVVEAANGADALRLAAEIQPALVLLDIRMPDMNGFAVCRRLKADPKTAPIPVVHISSVGKLEHDYPEALESGAEAYLKEPVEPAVLIAVVTALIRAAAAEARARKTERDAVDILECIGEAMYLLDEEYRFTYVNTEAERLLGRDRESLIGKTLHEAFAEPLATKVDHEYRRVMTERTTLSFENFYEPWQRWFEVKASPMSGGGIGVHFRDITERKHAERERQQLLRDLTERTGELQAVLDAAPVAIWIAHDPRCLRITGNVYSDEAIMRGPREGNISRSALPGDAAVSYKVFRNGVELRPDEMPAQVAAATGQPIMDQEFDLVFPDGRTISMLAGAVPLFDAEGQVRGSVTAGTDVTLLRRAEAALRNERAALEEAALFPEQNPSPVLRVGDEGVLLYANPSSAAVIAEWKCDVGQSVPEHIRRAVEDALTQATPSELHIRAGGRDYSFVVAPIAGCRHANLYGREVTKRKRLADALRDRIEELETVLEVAPVAIWVAHDPECRDITGNRMGERMYEAEAGENVSANVTMARRFFQAGRELGAGELPMQAAARTGVDIRDSELDVLLPSGRLMHMLGNASPLRDAAGRVRGCVGAFLDITERKLAERGLRISEERYRTLFTSMSEGFALGEAICDQNGSPADFSFIEVNDGFERQSGLGREILNRPMRDVLPNLEPVWIETYCRVALTGEPVNFDEYNRDTGRHYRVFCYSPARGLFAILFSDITDIKRAEQALRESERQFRIMGETVPYGVWLCGPDGGVRYCSKSFLDLVGITQEEQQQFGWTKRLVPEDLEPTLKKWLECCATGAPWEHEHRILDRNGNIVTILSKGLPVRDADGSITCWVGVNLDITSRKRSEKQLLDSEARFRSVVESNMIGVVFSDPVNGQITYANDEYLRIIGRSRAELEDGTLNWKEITPPTSLAFEEPLAAAVPPGARFAPYEKEYVRPDGSRVPVIIGGSLLEGPDRCAVAFVLDNSERKRTEERLRQMQKLESIGLLAGGIAHDFNNLLTGIMGNASLIMDEVTPQVAGRVKDIISSAERAAHLTRQLLAYSGKGQFFVKDLDLTTCLREMMDLICLSIPKSVELRLDTRERLPLIQMDPSQLQQVVMNLIVNAGEAIGEGNRGTVSVVNGMCDLDHSLVGAAGEEIAAGRYVYVEVADTGPGMNEQTKARIFDPFFTTKFMGRGLGLAAVAGIIRSQKGAVTVESESGRGSTFRVYLPPAHTGHPRGETSPPKELRGTILVVDDEDSVRKFMTVTLRRHDFEVLEACDGVEALEICGQYEGRFDAIILDIVMPAMGASEFLPEMQVRWPGLKVLLTSGYSEQEARRLCAWYEHADFIQKPYTAQQLLQAVELLLGA